MNNGRQIGRGFVTRVGLVTLLAVAGLTAASAPPAVDVAPQKLLGIFGGMGPEATANLYYQIVRRTPAEKDQDHIPTLIYSFPQVPDRTTAIRSGNRSIISYLVEGVTRLEKSGASLIVNAIRKSASKRRGGVNLADSQGCTVSSTVFQEVLASPAISAGPGGGKHFITYSITKAPASKSSFWMWLTISGNLIDRKAR